MEGSLVLLFSDYLCPAGSVTEAVLIILKNNILGVKRVFKIIIKIVASLESLWS